MTIIQTQKCIVIKATKIHEILQGPQNGGNFINGAHCLFFCNYLQNLWLLSDIISQELKNDDSDMDVWYAPVIFLFFSSLILLGVSNNCMVKWVAMSFYLLIITYNLVCVCVSF